ncbi:sensor histidine kinase [Microbacterium aurum]|uniref:sensor histidine kinase n=1 Tax=Microbacterium aurum TaxID=36805 RepID=UPI0009FF8483|nr:ATP-binding protein [Microbacterium aurum]MBM7829011.1 signal transduction histidine kinase [Microbacterium aurum]
MTAEPLPIAVDPAVRRPLGDIAAGAERFTQARVERIIGVVVALGFAVLGVQAFLNALGSTQESPPWHLALMIGVFAPLALAILACATGIGVRVCTGLLAVVLPLAVIAWPVATAGRGADAGVDAAVTVTEHPWVWYLLNVATVAAVMAFRMPLQIAWAVLVPVLYAAARLLQMDAAAAVTAAVILDAVFAMILAGVVIALAWMLRTVALGIDRARRDAVDSYAAAAAADAAETERIAVAALMHDSVLAALIAAERAETPREEALAAAMAREALTRLANADHDSGEGPDDPVAPAGVAAGIQAAARELGAALTVRAEVASDAGALPGRVARALVLAATQAIANAVQHAGAAGLQVTVQARAAGIRVRIADAGGGFDPAAIPEDRLGIRGSIVARTAAVGGRARVQTTASGTVVTLEWGRRA